VAVAGAMSDWFADEAFWTAVAPFEFTPSVIAAGAAEVDKLLRLPGVPRGGTALDLGCGPGRHAVPLARRGFRVTGVDLSPFLLARARDAAAAAGVSLELVRADMREFVRPETFDLAVSLFTSFGYFDDPADDLRALRAVRQSLRPGGILVVDVLGKERVARIFQASATRRAADGTTLVERHAIVDDWGRVSNAWTIANDGTTRTFEFTVRIYSGVELRDILERAGFAAVNLHGGFDGRPYGLDAERLLAVAAR
jgi:SAM-dependent methyltransferase